MKILLIEAETVIEIQICRYHEDNAERGLTAWLPVIRLVRTSEGWAVWLLE